MTDRGNKLLCFGSFVLDRSSEELHKNGARVKLQSQHFQLLALLAERAGELVTREEIRKALWDDHTFVDFDRSISLGINQIRSALRDDPRSPRYIETLPRKGYRFVAPVTFRESDDAGPVTASPYEEPSEFVRPIRTWRRWLLVVGALVALVFVTLLIPGVRERLSPRLGLKPIQSLAVLPLENLSRDADQEYFAAGMTDELITALAKISALRVVSRTSTMQYQGTKKPLTEIARELNVDALVEGTVLRSQGRVRITAQLIRASPEQHLWAEHYEGTLDEVLTLQNTVAQAVARAIQAKVTSSEQARLEALRVVNAEAYEAYLKGHYFSRFRSEENLEKSKRYFEQAVDQDPGFAPAWIELAEVYELLGSFGVIPRAEASAHVKAAAEKALAIDSSSGEPLALLGSVKTLSEWDWEGAEGLYKRAIELDPLNAYIPQPYFLHLAAVGRPMEAIAQARRSAELDPLYIAWNINVGWSEYFAHQYYQAERECRKLLDTMPNYSWVRVCLASVYLQTGRGGQAIPELRKALDSSGHGLMELMYLGHDLAVTGNPAEARQILGDMKQLSAKRYVPPESVAMVYQGLGDTDEAFRWLERAYRERTMHPWISSDPRLDPIRSDPRFKDLMRRMGLAAQAQ